MIEIQTYCPKPTQIGAHLRIVAPLGFMRRERPDAIRVSHEEGKDAALHTMMQADVMILQRPFSEFCLQRARMAKLAGGKLWIDWDDDLTAVHPSNKVWKYYQSPELKANLEELQDLADVITLSTEKMKDAFGQRCPEKVRLLPNAVEDRLIPDEPPNPTRKVIMWRGSDSHMHDLATFRDVMIEFAKEHSPEWKFCFIGSDPSLALHGMPEGSWRNIPEMDYYEMMGVMQKFAAPIHIVPLADNDFNRAKSNLAYVEASCAGSAVIAPNWDEWQRPGVSLYEAHSPNEFYKALKWNQEHHQGEVRDVRVRRAFDHVREHHALSVVNKIRWDILQELTN